MVFYKEWRGDRPEEYLPGGNNAKARISNTQYRSSMYCGTVNFIVPKLSNRPKSFW